MSSLKFAKNYDVIIVGAGPAGIFAALELAKHSGLSVLLLEKGEGIETRGKRLLANSPRDPATLLTGWGGAGAFSDGKLTMSPEVGGQLASVLSSEEVIGLLEEVDQTYLSFGAPEEIYGVDREAMEDLACRATLADLHLIPARIRHMGSDRCPAVLTAMRQALEGKIEIRTGVEARAILAEKGQVVGLETSAGETIGGKYIILAPGRVGSQWLTEQSDHLGLKRIDNPVDVGVRVEVPAPVMEEICRSAYESKLVFYSKAFDDKVRTFCMCPNGEVVIEQNDGVMTVNGHSYSAKKTDYTNFALLVSTAFTEPFREPIAYGRYLATLANLLGGGVLVQRLGDLLAGRRSTPERMEQSLVRPTLKEATPGDLSSVLPYRHLADILEMIQALDKIAPGVASRHTLLYGVEVKFYSARPKLTPALETEVTNLFAIGDGAGVTRGLVQASASGLVAAREIRARLNS
jgi:uncharacterized protein